MCGFAQWPGAAQQQETAIKCPVKEYEPMQHVEMCGYARGVRLLVQAADAIIQRLQRLLLCWLLSFDVVLLQHDAAAGP